MQQRLVCNIHNGSEGDGNRGAYFDLYGTGICIVCLYRNLFRSTPGHGRCDHSYNYDMLWDMHFPDCLDADRRTVEADG